MVKIEKNIPLPPNKRAQKWPWHQMDVGDSFFAPGYCTNPKKGKLLSIQIGKKLVPNSFWVKRSAEENGIAGVRVWRVE